MDWGLYKRRTCTVDLNMYSRVLVQSLSTAFQRNHQGPGAGYENQPVSRAGQTIWAWLNTCAIAKNKLAAGDVRYTMIAGTWYQ